jgi:hypothetical protein
VPYLTLPYLICFILWQQPLFFVGWGVGRLGGGGTWSKKWPMNSFQMESIKPERRSLEHKAWVCSEDDDFVGCGRPHAFPEAFLKFMIIFGALVKWPTFYTELLLCPCMIALHCSRTALHCTERERERERESDRYYYYHGGAIMQRTQTAGSNWSWDCLYCGTLAALTPNSIVCKNVENSKKYLFQWTKICEGN